MGAISSLGASSAASNALWYAVQTQPSRGHIATLNLERQGFCTFVPMVMRRRMANAGKVFDRLEPLFPAYQFVKLDLERDQWRSINGTLGVSRLVTFGDRPAHLERGFVEALLNNADERSVVGFKEELKAGDQVRVIGGVFDDLIGTLLEKKGGDRVIVLMSLLSG